MYSQIAVAAFFVLLAGGAEAFQKPKFTANLQNQ
jgi:hypothetical protein